MIMRLPQRRVRVDAERCYGLPAAEGGRPRGRPPSLADQLNETSSILKLVGSVTSVVPRN